MRDITRATTSAAEPAKKHAVEPNGLPAFGGGAPGDVLPPELHCGRTMNPQTYAVLLEIARMANVTPQEAYERALRRAVEAIEEQGAGLVSAQGSPTPALTLMQ